VDQVVTPVAVGDFEHVRARFTQLDWDCPKKWTPYFYAA
jgi:hypothetical protein